MARLIVTQTCQQCGAEFQINASQLKRGRGKYCSRQCNTNSQKIDLLGQRFGRLLVIGEGSPAKKDRRWICKCDCGNKTIVQGGNLHYAKGTRSCGCLARERRSERRWSPRDLTGRRFVRLVVLSEAHKTPKNPAKRWHCVCDCGNKTISDHYSLLTGESKSCGCLRREQTIARVTKHGLSHTPEFKAWSGIRKRCTNPNDRKYLDYGGRGIFVCERWNSFENFFTDMGPRPSPKHEIERLDNNGPYSPDNCKWATHSENMRNTRRSIHVEYEGRQWSLSDLADHEGISRNVLYNRLYNGWDIVRAVETPIRRWPTAKASQK